MDSRIFWNNIGSKKDFEDPLYLEKLSPFMTPYSKIIEYGCGYGRLLGILDAEGYRDLTGFDFAPNMIERGQKSYPHLKLILIEESGNIPVKDHSCDVVIISTILCGMVDKGEQIEFMHEIDRVVKPGGILYFSDFLICDHPRYLDKYRRGYITHNEWGIYTTSEGITVRHYTSQWLMHLLSQFDILWFEQFDFKTMNHHFAKTFHCIAKKPNRTLNEDWMK